MASTSDISLPANIRSFALIAFRAHVEFPLSGPEAVYSIVPDTVKSENVDFVGFTVDIYQGILRGTWRLKQDCPEARRTYATGVGILRSATDLNMDPFAPLPIIPLPADAFDFQQAVLFGGKLPPPGSPPQELEFNTLIHESLPE